MVTGYLFIKYVLLYSFTSFSVDTMKQTSHTNKTETTGNFSQMYPIQAVTRLVWNCIYVNTDTWFIP